MRRIELSIVILSYNTKELLRKCLESLEQEARLQLPKAIADGGQGERAGEREIIIVDNGSKDGSAEYINEFRKLTNSKIKSDNSLIRNPLIIKLIENKENVGFAKGNNQGIKEAEGKYILLLNSDTIVKHGAITKLIEYLDNHPEIAAVSPLLLNRDGSIQKDPCYLRFPGILNSLLYYQRPLRIITDKCFPTLLYSTLNFKNPSEVEQLPGAALVIKKDIFKKIGGFDENYQHFFEDVDLSYRLKSSGYRLCLVPEAEIIHFGGRSLAPKIKNEGIESYYYLCFKNLFRFCRKNYSKLKYLTIKFIIIAPLFLKLRFQLVKKLI